MTISCYLDTGGCFFSGEPFIIGFKWENRNHRFIDTFEISQVWKPSYIITEIMGKWLINVIDINELPDASNPQVGLKREKNA